MFIDIFTLPGKLREKFQTQGPVVGITCSEMSVGTKAMSHVNF